MTVPVVPPEATPPDPLATVAPPDPSLPPVPIIPPDDIGAEASLWEVPKPFPHPMLAIPPRMTTQRKPVQVRMETG
jgi:hypothetical protein